MTFSSLPRLLLAVLVLLSGCTVPHVSTTPNALPVSVDTVITGPLRPPVMGRNAGVSAGHPLTTAAAMEILQQGGNALDAGVAALLVGGVVEQDLYGIGGEALILVYPAMEGEVVSVTGQGWAPGAASIDDYGGRPDARRERVRSIGCSRSVSRRADRARTLGHDELRRGREASDRICRRGISASGSHGRCHQARNRLYPRMAFQPIDVAESRWIVL